MFLRIINLFFVFETFAFYITMKFGLLICTLFVIFPDGNSDPQDSTFGKFYGKCPKVKSVPSELFEKIEGEWYTQRVLGRYSPWRYLRCQSSVFDFKPDGNSIVRTRFSLPILPISFHLEGKVKATNIGEYALNYQMFGNLPQKISVLHTYGRGEAALIWTCSDFEFYHLESFQLITKFKLASKNNDIEAMVKMAQPYLRRYGLSSETFVEIDQNC